MRLMTQDPRRLIHDCAAVASLLVICSSVAISQRRPTDREIAVKADAYMATLVKLERFSGSVLIARDGKAVLIKGFGLANRELGVANDAETRFRLASITKQFTAVAVLMLQDRGVLSVSDSACKYLLRCPEAWRAITLHQLLSHTSGLPDVTDLPDFSTFKRFSTTPERTLDRIKNLPLDFSPGSAYKYSNSGYIALGMIIERASGKTYEAFVKDEIFGRLGMRNTGVDVSATLVAQRAAGYQRRAGAILNADFIDMSLPYAAGWFYTTVGDMKLWDNALYGEKLLPAHTIKVMFTPVAAARRGPPGAMMPPPGAPEHGYAWNIMGGSGRRSMYTNGLIDGFTSWYVRYPEQHASIIILSNFEGADLRTAANDLSAIMFGEPYEMPSDAKSVEIDPGVAQGYVGRYEVPASTVFENPALRSLKRPGASMILEVANDGATLILRPKPPSSPDSFNIEDRLVPQSDGSFRSAGLRVRVTFTNDATGRTIQMELHDGSQTVRAQRVAAP